MPVNESWRYWIGVRVTQADSPLKILHVLDHSLPLHSGYTFRTQNILRAQQRRGWRPVGLTSPKHELSWSGQKIAEEEIEGLCFYRTSFADPVQGWFTSHIRMIVNLSQRILEVAKIERPAILHAHSPVLNAIAALWAGQKLGIPVIYEIRAFWEDAAVDHGTYAQGSLKYHLLRNIESWTCRRIKQIAVLCEGVKNDLLNRGLNPEKLTVIPNGVNLDDFQLSEADEELRTKWNLQGKKVIAFIGSFYRYEGLQLLVTAFADLLRRRKDIVLLLVGGGEVKEELEAQVRELGIDKHVVMPGRLPHTQIPGVYGLADVMVYPRISVRLTELVTPLKPLEAMIAGKPLLASDISGHRELIRDGETGILFEPGNAKSLVGKLEHVLCDNALHARLSTQGQTWVRKERSWDVTTSGYKTMYEKVLLS